MSPIKHMSHLVPRGASSTFHTSGTGLEMLGSICAFLTVYVAAVQVFRRRLHYRVGTSILSLGRWRSTVVSSSLLRMQTHIKVPRMHALHTLVENDRWHPEPLFPMGFEYTPPKKFSWAGCFRHNVINTIFRTKNANNTMTDASEESDTGKSPADSKSHIVAETSWVNFLEVIGVTPESNQCYELQTESQIIGGIIPMRWKGPHLVALSAMLGFQASEEAPNNREPMPLPTQWSGPIGWLQFRAGTDSCVAEFRRRHDIKDRLTIKVHDFLNRLAAEGKCMPYRCSKARLWHSINGLRLPNTDKILYFGGSDGPKKPTTCVRMEQTCKEVVKVYRTAEGVHQQGIFGADADFRQRFLRCISLDNGGVDISSAYPEKHTVRVLNRRPGFLTTTEGERIASRGLGNDTVEEYNCEYISTAQLNRATHPYNLGDLYMNITLLQLMKEALLELQPDGYFFTPAKCLAQIVNHVYAHVDMICEEIKDVKCFDPGTIGTYSPELYYAIVLCREIQSNREISDMLYTVRDMRIVSIAAAAVKSLFSNLGDKESNAQDLVWAVLVCPRLLQDLARIFSAVSIESLLSLPRQSETTFSEKGILHIEWLATFANKDNQGGQIEGTYKVPIMYTNERREFTPTQLVAAYVYVFLTFFWVSKAWVTDVTVYDVTIPQIVNMC